MNNIDIANNIIDNFTINECDFLLIDREKYSNIKGDISNKVYIRNFVSEIDLKINFYDTKNNVIFLGKDLKGSISITVKGDESFIYIGNDCSFRKLVIDSNQKSDFVAIGNHVTTNVNCAFRSGLRATAYEIEDYKDSPGIIIGDDCMFAANCLVRSSDAHPIMSYPSLEHLNESKSSVVIEEHVWIAGNVTVLKNTYIGANSIIALDTVVTKNIPRYSIVKGNPMTISSAKGKMWQREFTKQSQKIALLYYKKYEHSLN